MAKRLRTTPLTMRSAASRLSAGFDALTLEPSSRLRARRRAISQTDPLVESWRTVTRAVTQAVRSMSRELLNSR